MILKKNTRGYYIVGEEEINFIKDQYYNEKLSQQSIAKSMDCSVNIIAKTMKKNNLKTRNDREQALKYRVDENYFECIDDEHKAYWLGFMYADGFISNKRKQNSYKIGMSLSECDKEILDKFNKDLNSNYPLKRYTPKTEYNSKNYYRLLISSNKLAEDLIDKGCITNKTKVLCFPNERQVPSKFIKDFIRGYNDGDGCITIPNNSPKIKITGTLEVIQGIQKYFNIEHLKLYQRYPERNINNYSLDIGGRKQVVHILNHLYENSTIYLERKHKKYLDVLNL